MPDELPTGDKAVYIFLEMIALGFALEAVAAFMRGDHWWKWPGALVLGILFLVTGVKWPQIKQKIAPRFRLFVERIANNSVYRWSCYSVAVMVILAISGRGVYRYYHTDEKTGASSAGPSAPIVEQPPFRVVIKYIQTDWGQKYNPRTLFMVYYLLNNSPKLSPVDLLLDLRIINLQANSTKIEAWSVETAPTSDGPWLALVHMPSSPHLNIYVVGSLKNQKSAPVLFPDLQDSLSKPIPSQDEATGWVLCECPAQPPCLGWYERIKVRDISGKEHFEILSLSDYNSALTDNTADIGMPRSNAPGRDLTHIGVLRPFPRTAYRIEPKTEGGITRLFQTGPPS